MVNTVEVFPWPDSLYRSEVLNFGGLAWDVVQYHSWVDQTAESSAHHLEG